MGQTNVRLLVAAMYDSDEWRQKVANMPNRQVYAIYRSSIERKNKKKLTLKPRREKIKTPWPIFETTKQYTIFDY